MSDDPSTLSSTPPDTLTVTRRTVVAGLGAHLP